MFLAGLLQFDDNLNGQLPYYVRPPVPRNWEGSLPDAYKGADQVATGAEGGHSLFHNHITPQHIRV